MTEIADPPEGCSPSAAALWAAVLGAYELDTHEHALLTEACRTVTLLDALDRIVRAEGAVIDSPQGRKASPAAVEARQQRITLARLLAALRLPVGEEDEQPQRRGGVRGTYQLRPAQ